MLTKSEAKKLRRLVHNYVRARVDDVFKGGGDPKDIPAIEGQLRNQHKRLFGYIESLTQTDTPPARPQAKTQEDEDPGPEVHWNTGL